MQSREQTLHLKLALFFYIVQWICPGAWASANTKRTGNLDSGIAHFISLCIETSTQLPCVTQLICQELVAATAGRNICSSEMKHTDQVIFSNESEPRLILLLG